jgi:excisionase family DNA binding protein
MKSRPAQFGQRENTASSRQYASRLAMNASVLQSDPLPAAERPDESTHEPVHPIEETFELSPTEPGKGATGGEESRPITSARLGDGKRPPLERPLTCEEAAAFVRVHPRTVKRMARAGKVPGHFRFGRWYFYASELDCWMRMELHSARHPWGSNIKEDVNV